MYNIFYESPIGLLEIICDDEYLLGLYTVNNKKEEKPNSICLDTQKELEAYFSNELTEFSVPVKYTGTNFQNEVWQELNKVKYGATISYLEIAKRVGNIKGVRAVANAVGANKILIIIPCHRIVGSDNSLTGFGGGLDNKIKLLELEGFKINIKSNLKKSLVQKN